MTTATTVTDRLAGGQRQHLYTEATAVEECGQLHDGCVGDVQCCPGMVCEYFWCIYV